MTICLFMGITVCLLVVMTHDRFVAMCKPLHYTNAMISQVCIEFILGTLALCLLNSSQINHFSYSLFCGENHIPLFFGKIRILLKYTCSDTSASMIWILSVCSHYHPCLSLFVLIVYICVVITMIRIPSVDARFKVYPPVTHIWQWSPYLMRQPYICTSNLSHGNSGSTHNFSIFCGTVILMLNLLNKQRYKRCQHLRKLANKN